MRYQIGTSADLLNSLELLGLPLPNASPVRYAKRARMGNGGTRGLGWLSCEWRWAAITLDEVAELRTFCSGESAAVYVQTGDGEGDYPVYSGRVVWPEKWERRGDVLLDFTLTFEQMVEVV